MTLLLAPPPPWVVIGLDTTGPVLTLDPVPGVLQPPDTLVVTGTADEPLSDLQATFLDPLGAPHRLGVTVTGLTFRLTLPTVGLATGRGRLQILARDIACNTSALDLPVFLDRPRPFDLQGDTMGSAGTRPGSLAALDLQPLAVAAYAVTAGPEAAADLQSETVAIFTLTSEALDG